MGVGISLGSEGFAAGITVSASAARGNADGEDLYHSNSQIKAGNQLHIQSGGDTHLIGAVAQGKQVTADIGGNLTIQSLQDTSRYDSKNQSASGSGTFGFGGASVSATYSQSEIDASYASVNQQSGIQAGDGGFQLKVAGDTELMGAVITSTDEAINNNRNSLDTASIQMQDINNHSRFSAEAFSVGTGGAGYGSDGEKESSVTQSGISGLAGNIEVRTGDASTGLQNSFDADKVQKETDAQLAITTQFRQQAHQAVGDYVTSQRTALQEQIANASTEEEKNLLQDQLNDLRNQEQAMNVVIGALTGFGEAALTKEVLSGTAEKCESYQLKVPVDFLGWLLKKMVRLF